MKVFILAGEASGDVLGAAVIESLQEAYGDQLVLGGLGGPAMEERGLKSLFDYGDVAVMGLVEVLRRYLTIRKRLNELKAAIADFAPDVLILIDAQGLSYRLGKHFKDAPFKKLQLVAPTVWAWKPERAAKAATYLDHMACLFPFEPSSFEVEGLPASFVGHPALSLKGGDKAAAREALGLTGTWAAVLPGSRRGEVHQLAPIFGTIIEAAHGRGALDGVLIPVAGTVSQEVTNWANSLPLPVKLLANKEERAHLCGADVALAASGTVSLELSAQGLPTLLAYRFNPLTWLMVRGKLTTKYMGLTNLLADQEIQREFRLNQQSTDELKRAFDGLLKDASLQTQVREQQFEALERLKISDGLSFGQRVVARVQEILPR